MRIWHSTLSGRRKTTFRGRNANMAFDLRPTEDVPRARVNANMAFRLKADEDVHPAGNANIAIDLRPTEDTSGLPTEDVLPWPGNANMAFEDLQCLLRTFYIRRYLRGMHEDNYNGIVIPL
ncbi:hypothetical protein Tco_0709663 [Tanacetum coccineum]